MRKPFFSWFLGGLFVVLAPAGLRMLTWRSHQIDVDDGMAQAGDVLFTHEWKVNDPLSAGGDGLGPVFNENSCVACHNLGGKGGAGGLAFNVTTYTVRPVNGVGETSEGVVHSRAIEAKFQESLGLVSPNLPPIARPNLNQLVALQGDSKHCVPVPTGIHISQRNTPALFGAKLIDEITDREIIAHERTQRIAWSLASSDEDKFPVGRASRLANGKVGKFGWKAQTASLSDFVQAACANELGLGNPGQAQPKSMREPTYKSPGFDLTLDQCDQLTAFVASLPKPVERLQDSPNAQYDAASGKNLFSKIGCADCHTPDLGSAKGLFSDLLLHRMGRELVGGGSYNEAPIPVPNAPSTEGPSPGEWRTPPLWGVADSAPYLHDGRAPTLEVAIQMHGGQGARSASKFADLDPSAKVQLVAFLKTLRAP